ncbi:hypothetical protein MTO96_034652 [Rhipicephalus appendiculatus]
MIGECIRASKLTDRRWSGDDKTAVTANLLAKANHSCQTADRVRRFRLQFWIATVNEVSHVSLAALVFSSKVYDTELGEFLDWDEGTILTASSKIRAVQLEPPEPSTLPPPVTAEVV